MNSENSRKQKQGVFASLDDDLLALVVNKVTDKENRRSFSVVCKQWFRVEGLDRKRLIIYPNDPWFSLSLIARCPNIVHLTILGCNSNTDIEFIAKTCPRIEKIMIDCTRGRDDDSRAVDGGDLSPESLCALGEGCCNLTHVEIMGWNAVGDSGVAEIIRAVKKLETLVLLNNRLMSEEALRVIGTSESIRHLKLVFCNVSDEGMFFLASGAASRTLNTLILEEVEHRFSSNGADIFKKMVSLEHLELSRLQKGMRIDVADSEISAIRSLRKLRLNNVDFSDTAMVALANYCCELEMLDIGGCTKVTGVGILAFCGHKCLKSLKLGGLKINLSAVEQVAVKCPSLDTVLLKPEREFDPTWSRDLMQDRTKKVVKFGYY